jgi:hypothetical protein
MNDAIPYQVTDTNDELYIWKNIQTTIIHRYYNQELTGEIMEITNNSSNPILLQESNLYSEGVLAIAIEIPNLTPKASSRAFIIKENFTLNQNP